MPFVLNTAYVEIKSRGLPQLNRDLKATERQINQGASIN